MIHLSTKSPLEGYDSFTLVGKGPSVVDGLDGCAAMGVNEAAVSEKHPISLGIAHDWTVVRDLFSRRGSRWLNWIVSASAWFRPECAWVRQTGNLYFDGNRVLGTDMGSKTVPGRMLGVGTATVALQLLAEAGVKKVYLNGFDNFWGDDTPAYADEFLKMGCVPGDYAKEFPASGTPVEQIRLVRESMQHVIKRTGIEVARV